jgi:hypothetical protein
MAHESFEDPETAALMNQSFVNVKVDREERPDVDSIYMEAVQAMTGRGGWPMTVWLTPDGRPFFSGTYFPREDRQGIPSFRRVMAAISEAWKDRPADVVAQAQQVTEVISREPAALAAVPGREALEAAYRHLERLYDPIHGGFGGAPKFPQQPVLEFLLRAGSEPWAPQAADMVRLTLLNLARGGIYDHLGGGFARYSVDAAWLVPHFEKMLYDNAQLARLYLWSWRELGVDRFRTVAIETLDYVLRDLAHPEGGLYSAEDADSEGVEGKFYLWSEEEFRSVAGATAASFFGVTPAGNFEGVNILHEARSMRQIAEELSTSETTVRAEVEEARRLLLERRNRRIRPGVDDKVVTSWNGLAIRALAEAGAVLGSERYLEAAARTATFVLTNLRAPDGTLIRSWSKGRPSQVGGFLEDYAAMALGLFALYQASGELDWFRAGEELTRMIPRRFADQAGGYFSVAGSPSGLIKRPKDMFDNPHPSGNSLSAEALLLLSSYTGEPALRVMAESAVRAGGSLLERYPSAVGHLLAVLHAMLRGTRELAVVGPEAKELSQVYWERFRPEVCLAWGVDGTGAETIPLLAERYRPPQTLAYLCEGFTCRTPASTADGLRSGLESTRAATST